MSGADRGRLGPDHGPYVVVATIGRAAMTVVGPFTTYEEAQRAEARLAGAPSYRPAEFRIKPLRALDEVEGVPEVPARG